MLNYVAAVLTSVWASYAYACVPTDYLRGYVRVVFCKFDIPAMARQRIRGTSKMFATLTLWCVLACLPH